MMSSLVGVALLAAAVIVQTAIVSRITLLQGPADLVLLILLSWALHNRVKHGWTWALIGGLMVGWVSTLPIWLPTLSYLAAVGIASFLKRQVWQIPIVALLVAAFAGTVIHLGATFLYLTVEGVPISSSEAFNLIVLPSLLLNIILAIPVNGFVQEIADWLHPAGLEA